ncbi:HAMP domain-containing sensor histidine kinase [Butyrivibrio sp. ob235]|uniref:HAMP domain-containing sensor histidine kinase n=1 Tax=Butyrivibrio sp. ob235 TaxID=1761780 RepID=UPI001587DDDB|nr:HAMP domain-containing sensor histidine kinase [Butyrivibrio sp. ob235]
MAKLQIKSITQKIMILFAISIAVSLTLFLLLFSLTNLFLDDIFQNSSFRKNVSKSLVSQFQTYVTQYDVKATDTDEIREWARENNIEYFTISRDSLLLYDNLYLGKSAINNTSSEQLNYTWLYASNVTFSDGYADVFIFKNTERIYYFIAYALAALLCVSVGFLIVFVGVRKEIRYIVELGNEVNKMHSGLENASFRVEGNDEISSLADAIESMRTDLIAKSQKEIEMKKAQDNLVLGMAHDLRTPLTSLMAYIEVVKKQHDFDDVAKYSDKALQKAGEIKSLSDQLFDFFLIDSGQKEQFEVVTVEYAFNDYLSEMCNSLSAQGASVEVRELSWPDQNVSISFDYIGRIINNIQSNIIKYADITKPVYLSTKSDGKNFYITIENTISDHAHKNASNGIGLKNTNSMMKKMNGDCIVHSDKSTFKIDLVIAMI